MMVSDDAGETFRFASFNQPGARIRPSFRSRSPAS